MSDFENNVKNSFTVLLDSLYNLEIRLSSSGLDEKEVHEWLFHVRDILYDWQGVLLKIDQLCETEDISKVPHLLNQTATYILYGTNSHNEWHMSQLENLLEKYLPNYPTDDDDDVDVAKDKTNDEQ